MLSMPKWIARVLHFTTVSIGGGSELAVLVSLIDSLGVAADSLYCGKDAQSFYEEFETTRCLTD